MNRAETRLVEGAVALFEREAFSERLATHAILPGGVFLATFLASLSVGLANGVATASLSSTNLLPGAEMTAWEIFSNNARVLLAILVGGLLTFTLAAFVVLLVNALHFGSSVGFLLGSYGPETAVAAFGPHGVFEVAAFVVAASVSVRVTVLLAARRVPGRGHVVERDTAVELAGFVLLAFALLALAAVVETTVTPVVVGLV